MHLLSNISQWTPCIFNMYSLSLIWYLYNCQFIGHILARDRKHKLFRACDFFCSVYNSTPLNIFLHIFPSVPTIYFYNTLWMKYSKTHLIFIQSIIITKLNVISLKLAIKWEVNFLEPLTFSAPWLRFHMVYNSKPLNNVFSPFFSVMFLLLPETKLELLRT